METSARVRMMISNNATWEDAFQFGTVGDTSWSFTGQNFRCDVKGSRYDAAPILTLTSGAGQIVVDDPVNRVLHFNVPEATVQASLPPDAEYVFDFIMYDNSTPAVRVQLMHGEIFVQQGVSGG